MLRAQTLYAVSSGFSLLNRCTKKVGNKNTISHRKTDNSTELMRARRKAFRTRSELPAP